MGKASIALHWGSVLDDGLDSATGLLATPGTYDSQTVLECSPILEVSDCSPASIVTLATLEHRLHLLRIRAGLLLTVGSLIGDVEGNIGCTDTRATLVQIDNCFLWVDLATTGFGGENCGI